MLALVELEERHKIAGLIENVIAADGVVTNEEREFLRRVLERLIRAHDGPRRHLADPAERLEVLRRSRRRRWTS